MQGERGFLAKVALVSLVLAGVVFPGQADAACRDVPAGVFCLTTPDPIWLGELTASQVDLSESGQLTISPLGPTVVNISWYREGSAGQGVGLLWFRATVASPNLRWQAMEWRLPGGSFSPLLTPNRWQILRALYPGEAEGTLPLEFRYLPTTDDPPGEYQLRLEFRLDIYLGWRRYWVRTRSEIEFRVRNWCILTIPRDHMQPELGTIGPELYDLASGTWTPLSSKETRLYAASNSPRGLAVTASATDLGPQRADLARLTLWGGELQGVSLDQPQQVLSATGPGLYSITDLVYRYTPSWEDVRGAYLVRVTYTLVAP